jgi:hypothetical protein
MPACGTRRRGAQPNRARSDPARHALLDYRLAATFFMMGANLRSRHKPLPRSPS